MLLHFGCFSPVVLFAQQICRRSTDYGSMVTVFSGQELAKLVASSLLLHRSWTKICELFCEKNQNEELNLRFQIYREAECTIIAFVSPPTCTRNLLLNREGLASSTVQCCSSPFGFLCSRNNPSFSLYSPAINLFHSFFHQLSDCKSQLDYEKPVIISGYSLGGAVASLFTLWLLDTIKTGSKCPRPLCITFGSPLIGDASLQRILENSVWNSCFLHVAATQDPVPKLLIPRNNSPFTSQTMTFKPFGTFLLCSELGFTCHEDPNAVLELLLAETVNSPSNQNWEDAYLMRCYSEILEHMLRAPVVKGTSQLGEPVTDSLRAGMMLQLEATGIKRIQQQDQQNTRAYDLLIRMEQQVKDFKEKRLKAFDPKKQLNNKKILMVNLEWYKKRCRGKEIGYYDFYKDQLSEVNTKIATDKKQLTSYWKSVVEEAEKKPQSESAALRKGWLRGGTNYRRMTEPLDIAEHYKNGGRDYRNNGRSQHYVQLEKWLNDEDDDKKTRDGSKKQDLIDLLTFDSCFWADVEEALILCELSRNNGLSYEERKSMMEKLIGFENHVMEMIKKREVSPEIFLKDSSFMRWWKEYEMIIGSYGSPFTEYMKNEIYKLYGKGG